MNVRHDVASLINRLHKKYPNKSPYIFGPGFEKSGFKKFDADRELVIPDAICANGYIREHAARSQVPPVSVPDIPKFERPVTPIRPRYLPPTPPPPLRDNSPESKDLPESFAKLFNRK